MTGTGTLSLAWTLAPTDANTANAIVKRDAYGNFSGDAITASTLYATEAEVNDQLEVTSNNSRALAVNTYAAGGIGVDSLSASTGPTIGVLGTINSGAVGAFGVFGSTYSSSSSGVFGQQTITGSATGAGHGYSAGVWGDSGSGTGMLGTADNSNAVVGYNNSPTGYTTAYFVNESTNAGAYTLYTNGTNFGGYCSVDVKGNLACSGSKSTVVPLNEGNRKVALAAIESPQNWFEDAGSGELVIGMAVVALDPDFAQVVNTQMEYQVFLTPYGDCKGLYVTRRTASSFEVHELGGGTANVGFGYRLMALRKNYERVRFADHTNDPAPFLAPVNSAPMSLAPTNSGVRNGGHAVHFVPRPVANPSQRLPTSAQ